MEAVGEAGTIAEPDAPAEKRRRTSPRKAAAEVGAELKTAVHAVLFDLDDTLVATGHHDRSAFRACARMASERLPELDGEALVSAYKRQLSKAPWDPEDKVPVSAWRGGLWSAALGELGAGAGTAAAPAAAAAAAAAELGPQLQRRFDDVRLGELAWIDGVPELLRRLGDAGLRTCLITNGHSEVQHPKLAALRVPELFQHIIVGGDEVRAGRKEKPDAGIFLKACGLLDVAPGAAVHVGDSLSADVAGAINSGLLAGIWVAPAGGSAPEGGPQPHFTISSVTKLPAVLADLGCGL